MNKRQKEVLQTFLDDEKEVLTLIKQNYHDALNEVNIRIDQLMSRDDADLSNVVYQISYQKALQSQISGIMSDLHGKEFNTISEYLVKSYENGYIGSMYDIHGQGIPIIVPIDQKNVVRAVTHDTKLSSDLYTSLGKDINKLSRQISAEISRGFSTAMTYTDIARNISDKAKIPQNRAMTIARTEAHRIQSESSLDAQRAAVKAGADVKKQWDAFLDGLTREAHQKLDGQIRDIEEPFEVDGYEAMFPGGFGVAELDINCRCALLQRASWALDQAELDALKERAAYFGLDKTGNFEEFKEKYMETDADAYIQKSIGAQVELLQKYGSEMNIFLEANYNDLQNWSAHKKITGMDENAIKSYMIQNVELWESLLNMQTEKQFEAYTDRLLSVATDAELRALNQWTGETYAIINRFERFGIAGDPISMDAARNIENVLNKMLTTEDIIAKRGSGTKHIFQNMNGDWKSNISVLEGQIFTDKGYTSVSPMKGGGFGGAGADKAEFIIKIPKGTHGAYISQESHYSQEKEFLLQKGYSYRIIKVGDKPNPYFEDESIIQIWCEVILDD